MEEGGREEGGMEDGGKEEETMEAAWTRKQRKRETGDRMEQETEETREAGNKKTANKFAGLN